MSGTTKDESAKFWIDRGLGGLELLRATYVGHRFVPHAHEGFAIGVIESGALAVGFRSSTGGPKGEVLMPERAVLAINPGEVSTGHAAEGAGWWTYRMLYPKPELLAHAASDLAGAERGAPSFPEPVIRDDALAAELLRLHAALEDPTTPVLEREWRLLSALTLLVSRHAGSGPEERCVGEEREAVRRAREYLEENFARDVTLEELAGTVSHGPFYLSRVFAREVGLPPHAYLTGVRLGRAKEMLLSGAPAGEAAVACGFVDQSHLTKRFRAWFGVTPGRYAARAREGT